MSANDKLTPFSGELMSLSEVSMMYAGFANAFRHPTEQNAVMSSSEYINAFDPSVNDQAISIQESTYTDMDTSALFEELVRFYEHFGLKRNKDAELPDHIGVELEFMHFLCEMSNRADENDSDSASVRNAQRDFLDRHVIRLINCMSKSMSERTGVAAELVESCRDFVDQHRHMLSMLADDNTISLVQV